jgi:hypothetical protein
VILSERPVERLNLTERVDTKTQQSSRLGRQFLPGVSFDDAPTLCHWIAGKCHRSFWADGLDALDRVERVPGGPLPETDTSAARDHCGSPMDGNVDTDEKLVSGRASIAQVLQFFGAAGEGCSQERQEQPPSYQSAPGVA